MNLILNNLLNKKLYLLLSVILFASVSLLNFTTNTVKCAFVYVLLVTTATLISELYGMKRAMLSVILFTFISTILWDTKVDVILLGSFISVIISLYCGTSLASKLRVDYNFYTRILISLIICSGIDSCIMETVLLSKFSLGKVLVIFTYDMIFKFLFSLSAIIFLLTASYTFGKFSKIKIH